MRQWLVLLLAAATCDAANGPAAVGRHGMISSAHPLATNAGIEILERGGNAFDAAVAVAATLNVVDPMSCGVGGFGLILVYDAKSDSVRALNASGRIPKSADPRVFRPPASNYLENRRGAKTTVAPVNARAWKELSVKYGLLPWESLFDRAIRAAEDGFVLSGSIPQSVYDTLPEHGRAIYGRNGKALAKGDRLVERDLGRSLRMIAAQGPEVLHTGELARLIADELRRHGSFVTMQDLKDSRPEWWDAISIDYRGYRIATAPPPANSFTALVRLGLMSQWNPARLRPDSIDYWHRLAEVTKIGEWDRLRYAGDPDVSPPPLGQLLSRKRFADEAARIDLQRARPFVPPGLTGAENKDTTHFVTADKWGNVVSATQTIGNLFGSRIMPPGTGIWLNDSLSYSAFEPAGNPMDVHPGRRKLNSNTPVIAFSNGKPVIALGAAGGHTIPQTVPEVLINLIDYGMNIQQALAAPRIAFVSERNVLQVESRLPSSVRLGLGARGHPVETVPEPGGVGRLHGVVLVWNAKGQLVRFEGGFDPRGGGEAKGY
jgi:gamma-glutamyltranspeptidase/glutathione hydrolase